MMNSNVLRLTVLILFVAAVNGIAAPASAPSEPAATQPAGERFYGTISAIDLQAETFTVDNKVYSIGAATQVTKAVDDSVATLADAKVGDAARGQFIKAADGKLNVTKVRFGRKPAGGNKAGGGGKKKPAAASQPAGNP
jgi:hypothetical protein